MRTTKLKFILQHIVILGILMGLLLCLGACKKKPNNTETGSTTGSSVGEETGSAEDTKPNQQNTPTSDTKPSVETTPSENTTPVEGTTPNTCAHVPGNWIVDKVSNCTTEGSRYKECTLCKQKVETEVIPKTAHSAGAWIVDKKATCTTEGAQHQECSQCKEKIIHIKVAKADHKITTVAGYDATATTPGRTDKLVCKVCEATVQESYQIPAGNSVSLTYTVNSDNSSCTITGMGTSASRECVIPETLSGYTVTAIGENAFSGNTTVATVYIPGTVTAIGANAFKGCSALTNITYGANTAKWNTVAKSAGWNTGTGSYTVYCTNNSVAK